jgi:hypothetical protein
VSGRSWPIAAGVSFAGTLALMFVLGAVNKRDRANTGFAFPDLQNAETEVRAGKTVTAEEKATEILTAWQPKEAEAAVRQSMIIDLFFPLFYASLIALACWRASRHVDVRWVAVAGIIAALAAAAGGLFDMLENGKMLSMLGNAQSAGQIGTVILLRNLKSGGIALGLLYLLLVPFSMAVKR